MTNNYRVAYDGGHWGKCVYKTGFTPRKTAKEVWFRTYPDDGC